MKKIKSFSINLAFAMLLFFAAGWFLGTLKEIMQ